MTRRLTGGGRILPAFTPSPAVLAVATALLTATLGGCVTKAKARAEAQAAFLAGQRQALGMTGQGPTVGPAQDLSVRFQGEVRKPMVPWTPELTLAKAIVVADYYGATDPTEIFIVRQGRAIRVDLRQLLNGQDVPLEPGDLVHLGQATAPAAPAPPP